MNLIDLTNFLGKYSVDVTVKGDELVIRAPKGVITTEVAEHIKLHKAALITLLREGGSIEVPFGTDRFSLAELSDVELQAIVASTDGAEENIQDIYPLAPMQEGILFHHLLTTSGDAYLQRTVATFGVAADRERFLITLQQVINRHDVLRTSIHYSGLRQPVQVVQRHAVLNVNHLLVPPGVSALQCLFDATDPRRVRFNLQKAPLIEVWVADDRDSGDALMALLDHHIVSDNYSLQLILSEVRQILAGEQNALPVVFPYRNFIAQLHNVPNSDHETYFRDELSHIEEPTAPFGIFDVQGDGSQVLEVKSSFSSDVVLRIRDISRKLGIPVAALFHLSWAKVLARCTDQQEVVFGTVLSGRLQGTKGANRTVGVFINTLPIRISVKGEVSVQQALKDAAQSLAGVIAHEHAALTLAQRCSGVASPLPLFTSILNYRHSTLVSGIETGQIPGLRLIKTEERTNFPITVSVDDLGKDIEISLQCVPSIDARRLCDYLLVATESLAGVLSTSNDVRLSEIDVLTSSQRNTILHDFNRTERDFPGDMFLHEAFELRSKLTPLSVALEHGSIKTTYGQLERAACRIAQWLRERGVRPGDRVAVCLERGTDMVAVLLGVLKAGAAYVPLDPEYPIQRLQYMLIDCDPKALVTQSDLVRELYTPAEVTRLCLDLEAASLDQLDGEVSDLRALGFNSLQLAYIIYTSGSTGNPKGVGVAHRPAVNLVDWVNRSFGVGPDDRLLFTTSICFDLSVYDIFGVLSSGAVLRIASQEELREPTEIARILKDERITFWDSAPAVFKQLLPFLRHQLMSQMPALRLAFFSGDWIPLDLPLAVRTIFPACQVIALGGATEATVWSNWFPVDDIDPNWASIPYGRPIQNARYYVLDSGLQPCPPMVAGDLYIGGDCLSEGYFRRIDLTEHAFLPDPFVDRRDARMYRTGDRARMDPDGLIEFLGRNDAQVKVRGFRVELGEIEAALCRIAEIREAIVMAPRDVSGERRLVAYYIPNAGSEITPSILRRALREQLAEYMVPAAFVVMEAFPVSSNGKLDRNRLPLPDMKSLVAREYEEPEGEAEQSVARIWRHLLGVEKVSRHDDFFELGGHSLLAAQFVTRLRAEIGFELSLRAMFEHSRLREIGAYIVDEQLGQFSAEEIAEASAALDGMGETELMNAFERTIDD